jgi:hypothetical protein
MKQTAVEWLADKMDKLIPPGNQLHISIILEKAKAMEREQIELALLQQIIREEISKP